jgi:hypothetical protein
MKVTVKKLSDTSRSLPWMVCHYANRKRIRKFFSSNEEAEQHAKDLRRNLRFGLDPEDLAAAQRLIAGTGYKLATVMSLGLAALRENQAISASPNATFADGAARVIELAGERNRRAVTLKGYEAAFGPLIRAFGARIACSITKTEVERYLNSLCDRKGIPGRASILTKRSAITLIRMALRSVGIANPVPGLVVAIPRGKDIAFFTNEQVLQILGAAAPNERGMVALALFAAIRPQTLERLPAECVSLEDRMIAIPSTISKDGYAHSLEATSSVDEKFVLPGVPDILWDWLAKYPFQPRPWRPLQERLREAIGGFWIHDGLRHTGATNYRARYGIAATANLLTHGSIALVRKHYSGITTKANAARFFAFTPNTVPEVPRSPRATWKKVSWPSDQELHAILQQRPSVHVARELGCSDSALTKHCKLRGIAKPARGAWSKRHNPFPTGGTSDAPAL